MFKDNQQKFSIDPDESLEMGCRCGSCWFRTGRWKVTCDDDMMFEMLFDTEEEARSWVKEHENDLVQVR